jgi:hypothetical protein
MATILKLDDWQKEVLKTKGNLVLCTGRQIGKTQIMSIKAAKRLLSKKCQIIIASLTEDQAQLIISMILNYLEATSPNMIRQGKLKPTKSKIQLKNGSVAISRPVGITGDSIRGFTGDVLIVDEASRMPEAVWAAAKPTLLTTAGELWLCSTPFGRKGYFYQCYQNTDRFTVFHMSSEEVLRNRPISPTWTKEVREAAIAFLEQEKRDMTNLQYSQEYLGKFVDDINQFFEDKLIQSCMTEERPQTINKEASYFLGVDIARLGKDESTFEIFECTQDRTLIQVENIITKKTRLTETTDIIIDLNKTYKFNKIFIDDGGIGVGVLDALLKEESTKRKVIGINNATRIIDYDKSRKKKLLKEDSYNHTLRLMERGKLKLLKDPEIFLSFKSVQYHYTSEKTGQAQLKIFGTYTHIVEGVIRAAQATESKNLNIWFSRIRI